MDEEPWRPDLAVKVERILEQERRSYRRLLREAKSRIDSGAEVGHWVADRDLSKRSDAAHAGFVWASELVQRLAFSIDDTVEALWLMFRHGRLLPLPAMVLSRQILESVLQTCWLMDTTVTPQMRIARAATLRPAYLNEGVALLKRFPRGGELAEKEQVRRELVGLMRRDGLEVQMATDKQNRPTDDIGRVVFDGVSASTRVNMTALLDKYFEAEDRWLYGLLSGAAHSKGWFLEGMSEDTDETIRAIAMPLLPISSVYTSAWCDYFELDAAPYRRARGARLQALTRTGTPLPGGGDVGTPTAFGQRYRFQLGDRPRLR